jgi:hypothetical protein
MNGHEGGSRGRATRLGALFALALALAIVAAVVLPTAAQEEPPGPGNFLGRVPRHGSFSQFPWEHIDAVTGDVFLSFVDLALPGNSGFNLEIRRSLNMGLGA